MAIEERDQKTSLSQKSVEKPPHAFSLSMYIFTIIEARRTCLT